MGEEVGLMLHSLQNASDFQKILYFLEGGTQQTTELCYSAQTKEEGKNYPNPKGRVFFPLTVLILLGDCGITTASFEWCMKWKVPAQAAERELTESALPLFICSAVWCSI